MPDFYDPCRTCKHDAVHGIPAKFELWTTSSSDGAYHYKKPDPRAPSGGCCKFFVADYWVYYNSNISLAGTHAVPIRIWAGPEQEPATPQEAETAVFVVRLYRKLYDMDHFEGLGFWKFVYFVDGQGKVVHGLTQGSADYPLLGAPAPKSTKVANTYRVAASFTVGGTPRSVVTSAAGAYAACLPHPT